MADIGEIENLISIELNKLENEINSLEDKEYQIKKKSLNLCEKLFAKIKNLIESYQIEIESLSKEETKKYYVTLQKYKNKQNELKNNLNQEKYGRACNELEVPLDDLLDKNEEKMKNIIATTEKGITLAENINIELDNQIEQLDRMHNTMKDTQTILSRSKKHIVYFFRQIITDKIILSLITIIVIAIIVIIVLKIVKK